MSHCYLSLSLSAIQAVYYHTIPPLAKLKISRVLFNLSDYHPCGFLPFWPKQFILTTCSFFRGPPILRGNSKEWDDDATFFILVKLMLAIIYFVVTGRCFSIYFSFDTEWALVSALLSQDSISGRLDLMIR